MDHSAQQNMTSSDDGRISLNLSEQMKQHQLANMRAHLVAIQNIVGMIADNKFEQASEVAHQQLGMTSRMEKMCNSFENEEFKKLGMAFHQSGDELGDILLEKDSAQSLHALHKTMNYCIECHATYRQ
jgi:cytochrome c556